MAGGVHCGWLSAADSDKLLQKGYELPNDMSQRPGPGHYASYVPH
jgi:hypothetical protein